ncbi:GAF domain-containing protein [Nocardia sp. NPDC046763]|uniref:GAF domain-containing protein n=1 Tax=Nocardia sp. NPDC046763 TaxID=3155256 RepID=UPI0033F02CE0
MQGSAVIPWVTAEILTPDAISVASVGGVPRGFAGWQRVLQRQLAKTPALYDGVTTSSLTDAVQVARELAQDVDLRIPTKSGPHALHIRPVLGPNREVHAIRLWMGPAKASVPQPGLAIGAIWDLASQTIAVPSGFAELTGISPAEYAPRISIAELFQYVSGLDRHIEVLDLLADPSPGAKLQFVGSVSRGAGHTGRWCVTIRARNDEHGRGAWLLIEDVTTNQTVDQWPDLECVGLREAHRRAGTHLAVIHLEHTGISHWLTDPAPWIRWDYLFHPGDVIHPDERVHLAEMADHVRAGHTVRATVRTLDYTGGYSPSSVVIYPYPGYSKQPLALVQFDAIREVASLPELAVVGTGNSSYSQPVGYDEQLRHRVAERMRRTPVH